MRDPRYENMWGETPEEQEKRRAWLREVYDRATKPEQTPLQANSGQNNFAQSGVSNNNSQFEQENNTNNLNQIYQNTPAAVQLNNNVPQTIKTNPLQQIIGGARDMYKEYALMTSHNYKKLDDYYHCKANYNATKRGPCGEVMSQLLGTTKEVLDVPKNIFYKRKSTGESLQDFAHDMSVNQVGRDRAKSNKWQSAQDACADYREKNKYLPKEYW